MNQINYLSNVLSNENLVEVPIYFLCTVVFLKSGSASFIILIDLELSWTFLSACFIFKSILKSTRYKIETLLCVIGKVCLYATSDSNRYLTTFKYVIGMLRLTVIVNSICFWQSIRRLLWHGIEIMNKLLVKS